MRVFRRQLLVPGGIQSNLPPIFSHEHSIQTNGITPHPSNLTQKFAVLLYFLCIICTRPESPRQFCANGKCPDWGYTVCSKLGHLLAPIVVFKTTFLVEKDYWIMEKPYWFLRVCCINDDLSKTQMDYLKPYLIFKV